MNRSRNLSELQGVCLGIVVNDQPCTVYYVRQALKVAPSSHWRASAGSVYPLLARMEADGLVETTSDDADGRGRKLLRATAAGRSELKSWVLAGADPSLVSSVTDPVRSRMFFLGSLDAPQRRQYLDRLIVLMEAYLVETQVRLDEVSEADDLYGYLGSLGAMKITEARLEWLRNVRERLPAATITARAASNLGNL